MGNPGVVTSVDRVGGDAAPLDPPPGLTVRAAVRAARATARHAPAPLLVDTDAAAVPNELRTARARARPIVVLLDAAGLIATMLGAWALVHLGVTNGVDDDAHHLGLWVLAAVPAYLLCLCAYGLYRRERRRLFASSFPDLVNMAHGLAAGALLTLAASHLLRRVAHLTPAVSLTGVVVVSAPALLVIPAARALGGLVVARRGMIRSRVIILGSGTVADSVARRIAKFDDVELLGCVDDPGSFGDGGRGVTSIGLLGTISDLPELCRVLDIDRVVVAFSPTEAPRIADTLRQLDRTVRVSVVPRLFDLVTWRSAVDELHGLPLMDVAPPTLSAWHRGVKRAMDLSVAVAGIVLTLPLWVLIAIAIKVTSPGPVFFRQDRMGKGGKPFKILKFRTMRVGADDEKANLADANEVDGPLFKIKRDPRVTPVGRVLRATSLDELPQFLNVIKGDMSLVGPRPFVVPESAQIEGWAARRYDVRPGMTGLWQVSGRNDLAFDELRRLDYAYVASWSLLWDVKIMWQTPACVLRRRGAY
ncbi:MAG TPA: sugar transferase [Acidimicrobiales bacterium]|nr:sugar transferase [Acidimicrobiales bacterium]